MQRCTDCNSDDFVHDHAAGDIICTQCGLVAEGHVISEEKEWAVAENERCFPMIQTRDGQTTTMTKIEKRDKVTGHDFRTLHQRQLQQQDAAVAGARHDNNTIETIGRHELKLNDSIINTAKELFHDFKSLRDKGCKGNVLLGVTACCLFYACRLERVSRSKTEIAYACGISDTILNKGDKVFKSTMEGSKKRYVKDLYAEVEPSDLILRYVTFLDIEIDTRRKVQKICLELASQVKQIKGLAGRTPESLACAVIFLACEKVQLIFVKKVFCEKLQDLGSHATLISVLRELAGHGIS